MSPLKSTVIAVTLATFAAPGFAQYRSGYPMPPQGNGPIANPQHPLWGIVGQVVNTVITRAIEPSEAQRNPPGPIPQRQPQRSAQERP